MKVNSDAYIRCNKELNLRYKITIKILLYAIMGNETDIRINTQYILL